MTEIIVEQIMPELKKISLIGLKHLYAQEGENGLYKMSQTICAPYIEKVTSRPIKSRVINRVARHLYNKIIF